MASKRFITKVEEDYREIVARRDEYRAKLAFTPCNAEDSHVRTIEALIAVAERDLARAFSALELAYCGDSDRTCRHMSGHEPLKRTGSNNPIYAPTVTVDGVDVAMPMQRRTYPPFGPKKPFDPSAPRPSWASTLRGAA